MSDIDGDWQLGVARFFKAMGAITLTGGVAIAFGNCALAQITPDATLGAESSVITPNVNVRGFPADLIEGGALRGANLFHSFEEFNVGEGRGAYFTNPAGVENILSRVTGLDPSDILGTLGVLGNANLFFLNPNGIIFGENARLDVGGSFVATTANSFVFEDGLEFSATNPTAAPLLTISVPLGLQYGLQPGAIASQGILFVDEGQSLILAGGDITLNNGVLFVDFFQGGRIELGAIAGEGTVGLNAEGTLLSLSFPDGLERANVSLTNGSVMDVSAEDGGSIAIQAQNINISTDSRIFAGIALGLGSPESQAGNITLDATDTIRLESGSAIYNDVDGTGKGGDLNITTGSLFVVDDSLLTASTYGIGNAGSVIVNARDRVSLNNRALILSRIGTDADGQGGDIDISTSLLELINGGQLSSATFGQGNAGNVAIEARNGVVIEGGIAGGSGIFSTVEEDAWGNGGSIEIQTETLQMDNSALVSSSTIGIGDAGNVRIRAQDITIDAEGDSLLSPTGISSGVGFRGFGRGGDIEIDTGTLQLLNSAELFAGVTGVGIGGDVRIRAQTILLAGQNSNNTFGLMRGSKITGGLRISGRVTGDGPDIPFGIGRAGSVDIETGSLILRDDASITVSTSGQGDAGNVHIRADMIALSDASSIFSSTFELGNAGDIDIQTGALRLSDGSQLLAFTEGRGTAGNIRVRATDSVELTGFNPTEGTPSALFTDNDTDSPGAGGNITITTDRFQVANGAIVDARTRNQDPGGNITINANVFEALGGGQLITTSQGSGRGGTITVNATRQILIDGSDPNYDARVDQFGRNRIGLVDAASGFFVRSQANGSAGDIFINAPTLDLSDGGRLSAETLASGNGGDITITGDHLSIREAGIVSTQALSGSTGRGGNITVNMTSLELDDRAQISASSEGTGDAGGVAITANEAVTLTNSDITTSAEQAAGGAIAITTDSLSLNRGTITAATGTTGAQGAANITLQGLDLLLMGNESLISANALNQANGGNVAIASTFVVATPPEGPEGSDITANAFRGNGGRVSISAQGLFGIEFRPKLTPDNDITVSSEFGLAGEFTLNQPEVDPSRGLAELPSNLVDAENQIDRSCTPGGAATKRSFIVTGRGGIPPSPLDPLDSSAIVSEWVTLDSFEENTSPAAPEANPTSTTPQPIVEATGWMKTPDGQVILVAQAPRATPYSPWLTSPSCQNMQAVQSSNN